MPNAWCFHSTSTDPSALLLEEWPPLLPGQALRALHHFQNRAHLDPEHTSPHLTAHTKQGRGYCQNQQINRWKILACYNLRNCKWEFVNETVLYGACFLTYFKCSHHSRGMHVTVKKIMNCSPKHIQTGCLCLMVLLKLYLSPTPLCDNPSLLLQQAVLNAHFTHCYPQL